MGIIVHAKEVLVGYPPGESPLFLINEIELAVSGKVVCVLGATGCGKSTFIKLLAGLLSSRQRLGNISVGTDSISYVPQTPIIFPEFNAFKNASYLATLKRFRKESSTIIQEVNRLGKLLRLDWNQLNATASTNWSGGEIQRISLVRALSVKPKLLLMDEPCTGLDVMVRRELLSTIRCEAVQNGTTVIYVTHHGDEVLWVADSLIVFKKTENKKWKFETQFLTLADALKQPPSPEVRLHLSHYTNIGWDRNSHIHQMRSYPPEAVVPSNSGAKIMQRVELDGIHSLVDLEDGLRFIATESHLSSRIGDRIQLDSNLTHKET